GQHLKDGDQNSRRNVVLKMNLRPIYVQLQQRAFGASGLILDSSDLNHMFDGCRIDSTNCQVQIDAAENLEARDIFSYEVGLSRRRLEMILQREPAHASGLRHLRQIERINRSRAAVGISVGMNIDHTAQRG